MSSFSFVSSGAQNDTGESSAVDVSAAARLSFTATFSAVDLGKNPDVAFTILDAPTSSGPWTERSRVQVTAEPARWPRDNVVRFALGGHQDFVKVAWFGRARSNVSAQSPNMGWSFAVAATGQP